MGPRTTRRVRNGPAVSIAVALLVLGGVTVAVHLALTPVTPDFLLTSLVVVLVPGSGVVYSVATAVASGWRRGRAAAIGCTVGILPHLTAAVAGLSGVMHTGARAFEIVRWLGVAYLVHLAVSMLRSNTSFSLPGSTDHETTPWRTVRRGAVINLLNPKLTLFFFAFLPQFLDEPPALVDTDLIGLGAIFMAMTLAVFLLYAATGARVRQRVLSRPRLLTAIERSFGAALLAFAARLAVTQR